MQNFLLFCKKKLTFSILHSYFTKHSHQFIYSTHLFNKIFISLTLFIYSQNPLISAPTWALSPTDQPHQSTILPLINPNRKSISHHYSSTFANTAINESQRNFQNPPKPYSTTSLPPPTKKTPSPSSLSLRNSNSLPIHVLLLLSPSRTENPRPVSRISLKWPRSLWSLMGLVGGAKAERPKPPYHHQKIQMSPSSPRPWSRMREKRSKKEQRKW